MADNSGLEYYAEISWMAWAQLSDTGGDPDGDLWGTRAVAILVAFMAMFIFAMVCAMVEQAINYKLEGLRRGKAQILEDEFMLIIGWTDRILPLVTQLCIAFESDGGGVVVILAKQDKPEMDDFLYNDLHPKDRLGTKIVTREGNPVDSFMLEKVSARQASSIVVLSDQHNPDEACAEACRVLMALLKLGMTYIEDGEVVQPPTPRFLEDGQLIIEIAEVENINFVKAGMQQQLGFDPTFFDEKVKTIVPLELTGKILIQCAMEPGLGRVLDHILAFEQNEFYFKAWPSLIRRKFADVCFMFEEAVPFGLRLDTPMEDGTVILLNPPGDQVIEDGDMVIVIAEDNDTYSPGQMHFVDAKDAPPVKDDADDAQEAMNLFIIGYRPDLALLLLEVEKWVPRGSKVLLFNERDIDERMNDLRNNGLAVELFENITLLHMEGASFIKSSLEKIGDKNKFGIDYGTNQEGYPCEVPQVHQYKSTIIISEQRMEEDGTVENPLDADSRVLISSVVVRGLQRERMQD